MLPNITAPTAEKKRLVNQTGRFRAFAKKMVLKQLDKLHTGRLIIHDGDQQYVFGEALPFAGQARDVKQNTTPLTGEIHIHDNATYLSLLTAGSIGAAESYITHDWSSPDLTAVVRIMVLNMDILDEMEGGLALVSKPFLKFFHYLNRNTQKGSRRNIAAHYDLGNDLFEQFLDSKMMYSSAVFPEAHSHLEAAAEHKLYRICEKLSIQPGDHIVEIGTGWGGFAIYAAFHYDCKVTTTTISEEQYALAKKRIQQAGLEDRITLLKKDYRHLSGQFDKLVSIEMIEAVGWRFYPTFFETCSKLLREDGVMMLQAITIEDQRYDSAIKNVDFIQRYIFPGSCIPSIHALMSASKQSSNMRLIYQEDFAQHYAQTLKLWFERCREKSAAISNLGYSNDFKRMWEFYLCYCEGGFAERAIGVSHMMYAKPMYRNEKASRI